MGRRKKKTSTRRQSLSLAQLSDLLAQREKEVAALRARRRELEQQVASVDAELDALVGGSGRGRSLGRKKSVPTKASRKKAGTKFGRGRASTGSGTLTDYIRSALTGAGPMKLSDLKGAVVAAGYPTKSTNLGVIISQRLPEMKDVKKVSRGVYAIGPNRNSARTTTKKKASRKKRSKKRRSARKGAPAKSSS